MIQRKTTNHIPLNEDLVFHLMNVLVRLDRYSEALARYTQLEARLLERGAVPREETKSLALRLREAGVTKYFSGWSSVGLPPDFPAYEILPPFSQTVIQDIIEVSVSKPVVRNGARGLLVTEWLLVDCIKQLAEQYGLKREKEKS